MTPEERARILEQTRQVAEYGHLPRGMVTTTTTIGSEAPEGIFTAEDLLKTAEWEPVAESVAMPGGKRVWVHPVTPDEARWLNAQAARDAKGQAALSPEEVSDWTVRRAQVYLVVMACRAGREWGAPRVFRPESAEAIQSNLPHTLIETIVTTSDRLGRGLEGERAAVADFFDATRTWAQTWSSRSVTASPETWQSALAGFASCVSRVSARGFLVPADVEAMRALVPQE